MPHYDVEDKIMRQTVLGVFDKYADARSAQRTLGEAGIAQADIAIYSMSNDTPVEKGPRVYAPGSGDVRHHNPVFDQLEQLFARLFRSGQYPPETEDYREVIRRGGTIVSADVSEMQVDLARDLMRRAGAADIEERAKVWRNDSVRSEQANEPSPAQQGDTIALPGKWVGTIQGGRAARLGTGYRRLTFLCGTPAMVGSVPASGVATDIDFGRGRFRPNLAW
ncbi:hypothetical protein [Paraburkholderia sp. SIMBA_030]|uniref:hypothetical protein n=1 Tax=Paraburkholderia sp. SIMBA_030 TaxID=3085773 RepID=UPI00397AC2BE